MRDVQLFSRPSDEGASRVDVRRLLDASVNIAAEQLRGRARVVKVYDGEVGCVEVNESRLGQVLLNLLLNAVQAIPEGDPSRHEIRLAVRDDPVALALTIEVSDTGVGIPANVLAHVFEPFFTTKPMGAGTGLGLSIAHGLVMGMGGSLGVTSEPGRGTTFVVRLPVAPDPSRRSVTGRP